MNHHNNFYYYVLLFFFIDLCAASLLSHHSIDFLFCFFTITCLSNPNIVHHITLALFLLARDSMYYHNSLLYFVVYLGILMGLFGALAKILDTSLTISYFVALLLGLTIKNVMYGADLSFYTGYEIFATIVVMYGVLKYMAKGKLSNRL